MREDANHGPKLNRDWIGLRVRLRVEAGNYYGRLAIGTTGVIDAYSPAPRRITFLADKCECCGIRLRVSRLYRHYFEILTPEEEWSNTQGEKRKQKSRFG